MKPSNINKTLNTNLRTPQSQTRKVTPRTHVSPPNTIGPKLSQSTDNNNINENTVSNQKQSISSGVAPPQTVRNGMKRRVPMVET
eukprot:UN01817